MGKIKYLTRRIFKMNYKNFFSTIDDVHYKTNRNKLNIFIDIINCGLKYEAGYVDYNLFEMYNMNNKERKTIITRGINNNILKKYNDKTKSYIFEDKAIFNKLYNEYLNREWIYLNDNYNEFKKYLKNKKYVIVKPLSLSCGKGVEKIKVSDYDTKEFIII